MASTSFCMGCINLQLSSAYIFSVCVMQFSPQTQQTMMNNKALNKTTSFLLNKPPSMKLQSPPKTEFPTSPELFLGEEIPLSSHPEHPLSQVDMSDCFKCKGCKEKGSGYRFTCKQCEFQLHEFCALAPELLQAHPFHMQHELSFHPRPAKGGIMKSKCDICSKPVKGYNFRCNACSFQMHPCCAMLSNEINVSVHAHRLRLLPAGAINLTNGDPVSFVCGECNRRRSGRVYRCTVCEYHLHAVCAKSMVNGLKANGFREHENPSMLGTAARIATQVVIEFIGGLIEGLGEGVGEMVLKGVARGRSPTTSTITD